MKAHAVESVGADDAEILARRTGRAVFVAPLVEQRPRRVGAAIAEELIAECVRNMRIGQRTASKAEARPEAVADFLS